MRLKEEKIDSIAKKILHDLKEKMSVDFLVAEDKILHEIKAIIVSDLKAEDALDEEINNKLKANMDKIHKDNLNYNELFRRAKNQIAKDRKIVL